MSQVDKQIDRTVVALVLALVRWRFGRQIRVAAATVVGVAALAALAAYVATRDDADAES